MKASNGISSGQRLDIQGIRAIAILSVLLFHFFPEFFPNGYLGVDVFFVISGYLISTIFLKHTTIDLPCIISFYYRRAKRIVPLYLVYILIAILLFIYYSEPERILEKRDSAIAALFFYTNIHAILQENDYFKGIGKDLFTHTWSLSMEMQFYLIVPFIFFVCSKLPPSRGRGLFLSIGFQSLVLFVLLPDTLQFNLLLARFWQFFATSFIGNVTNTTDPESGTKTDDTTKLCYTEGGYCEKKEITTSDKACLVEEEKEDDTGCSLVRYRTAQLLLVLPFLPVPLPSAPMRIVVVMATAFVIVHGVGNASKLLSCKVMEFLGDISYSTYLLHWPFVIFIVPETTVFSPVRLALVPCTLLISTLIYFAFERYYRRWSAVSIICFSTVFSILCVFLICFSPALNNFAENFGNSRLGQIKVNAIKINEKVFATKVTKLMMVDGCTYHPFLVDNKVRLKAPFGLCEMPNGDGKLKFAVIGNSYATNHAGFIHKYFKHFFGSFKMFTEPVCEPLAYTRTAFCNHIVNFTKLIEEWKPDVTFLMYRHYAIKTTPLPPPGRRDEAAEEIIGNMIKLLPLSSYFFILDAFPSSQPTAVLRQLSKFIRENKTADEINNMFIHREQMKPARVRTQKLLQSCQPKCQLLDIVPALLDSRGRFAFIDDQNFLSLFEASLHLSPYGSSRVEKLYPEFVRKSAPLLEELTIQLYPRAANTTAG